MKVVYYFHISYCHIPQHISCKPDPGLAVYSSAAHPDLATSADNSPLIQTSRASQLHKRLNKK